VILCHLSLIALLGVTEVAVWARAKACLVVGGNREKCRPRPARRGELGCDQINEKVYTSFGYDQSKLLHLAAIGTNLMELVSLMT
jgi:hypothetical protein